MGFTLRAYTPKQTDNVNYKDKTMAKTKTIKMSDELYEAIKISASMKRRGIAQEIVSILESSIGYEIQIPKDYDIKRT